VLPVTKYLLIIKKPYTPNLAVLTGNWKEGWMLLREAECSMITNDANISLKKSKLFLRAIEAVLVYF